MSGEGKLKIRQPAVEGSFYPTKPEEVEIILNGFDKNAGQASQTRPSAVIVPHAGLFYSGLTAAFAYKFASGHDYETAVIFAPSHRVAFYGITGSDFDMYGFSGGDFDIDRDLTERVMKKNRLVYIDEAHIYEHSAEIQLPFIRKYLNAERIAVFIYGETDYTNLAYAMDDIISEGRHLVIVSSDLSHFHSYGKCREIDSHVTVGIGSLDTGTIMKGEACGMTGILAVTECARRRKLSPVILDYRNSGDVTGEKSRVVGYMSAAFV